MMTKFQLKMAFYRNDKRASVVPVTEWMAESNRLYLVAKEMKISDWSSFWDEMAPFDQLASKF